MATTKATTLAHTLGGISSDISTAEINRLDNLTGDIQTQLDAKAPLASPTFTGTITAPNDSISGDAVSGGTIGAGTFSGTIGSGATFPARHNFLAYKDGNQTVNTSTTVQVSFQADAFSSWDGSTYGFKIANDYYVVPETGVYYIYFSGRLTDGGDSTGGCLWKLTHNEALNTSTSSMGSPSIKNFGAIIKEESGYVMDTHAMRVISLTQGDILRLYCRNMTGGQEAIMNTTDGYQCTVMGGFMLR